MAICEVCSREMTTAKGCTAAYISFDAEATRYKRPRYSAAADGAARCHDCNAADGQLHHPGCDWERCPKCGGQALSCSCSRTETYHRTSSKIQKIVLPPITIEQVKKAQADLFEGTERFNRQEIGIPEWTDLIKNYNAICMDYANQERAARRREKAPVVPE